MQNDDDTNSKEKPAETADKTNMEFNDDASSASSSSSEQKLKIDIDEDTDSNAKSTNETARNSIQDLNVSNDVSVVQDKPDEEMSLDTSVTSVTTTPKGETNSAKRTRKKQDLGLDGGYWSRVASEASQNSKPKRQRTTVERLNFLLNNSRSTNLSADDSLNNDDDDTQNSFKLDDNSINSESTTASKTKELNPIVHYILFRSKIFLAVRNDSGGFFLCQTVNKIYDDSKRCKIQWLEGKEEENKYKFGYVDFIDPATIITKVKVNKVTLNKKESEESTYYYEIVDEDLEKVKGLLNKALQDGGITVEFQSSESDSLSDKEVPKKQNNLQSAVDVELYDKEEDDYVIKKPKSAKKNDDEESSNSFDFLESEDESSNENVNSKKKSKHISIDKTKPSSIKSANQSKSIQKESQIKKVKQLKNGDASVVDKSKNIQSNSKTKTTPEKPRQKTDPIKIKPNANESKQKSDESHAFKKPPKPITKNKIIEDEDTDELESSSEEQPKTANKEQNTKKRDPSPRDHATNAKTKTPILNGSKLATEDLVNPIAKKRKLMKVVSNRFLDINPKVTVFAKDPFFEEDNESSIPFISPYVQSKLAFKALHLGNIKLLMRLINDVDHVPSVHVSKSICNKWIPAEYALYLENKNALEILIDNFTDECMGKTKRIQMPENMFQRFSTGVYNPKSLGIRNIRTLTESRGVKEGNNALTKDIEKLDFSRSNKHSLRPFFKLLFNLAFEYGISNELYDFLLVKWQSADQKFRPANTYSRMNDIYNNSVLFIYENIINTIIFGNRRLAAHILKNAPNGHGFNAVHYEVLNAENDVDLKCQLRANMCTKKPFANDLVTPIHCACINPNVKYLKTLLSITQDFNIADKRGRKPVHYAAVCEGLSPLEYLISRVSPYELDAMGSTPLHYACLAGRTANVEMLLSHAKLKQEDDSTITTEILMDNKYGIGGINKPNRRGQLPIHLAISKNNYDCVKVLIKYGCNVEYSMSNSMGKITPLMYAVQLGHQKIVQLLIDNNAKIEARDRHQRTATIHASMCGHSRTLSFLLHLGANPNVCDSSGNSCLHYACAYGWFYCIKTLLDAGAHVNVVNDWKLTPFGAAFLKGHVGICDFLLETYPKQIDINFRTENGETLVMLAVSSVNYLNKGSVAQLDYIVNKLGGNCQLVDSKGCNSFHYLAANTIDRETIEEELKESITDPAELKHLIDQQITEQEMYRNKMAEILLKANCNPNAENNEFETPFFTAVINSNHVLTKFLLTSKNVNLVNSALITSKRNLNGKTMLSIMAEKCVEIDTCQVILSSENSNNKKDILFNKYQLEFQKMAKISDENNLTPFQIACIKISDELKSSKSTSNPNYKLPEFTIRFLLFLYNECKSNPNEQILIEINAAKNKLYYGRDSLKILTNDETFNVENLENEFDDDLLSKSLMKTKNTYFSTALFELINDKALDLIESLVKLSAGSNLTKIDFNFYDRTGLTLILKSILLKQSKFALKLLELDCYDINNLVNQICRNKKYYLNENILQLAIRFNMINVVEKIVEILIFKIDESKSSMLIEFLSHQNAYNQNFLHILAMLDSTKSSFTRTCLNKIFVQLNNHLNKIATENTVFLKLCSSKDKLGRTPLHLRMINFGSSISNIDLEMFFLETVFTFNKQSSEVFKQKIFYEPDIFNRLPLHYLFYDSERFETAALKANEIYKITDLKEYLNKIDSSIKTVQLGNNITQIDPVELLSLLLRQMKNKNLDTQDIFGYSALHYAAIRGSTISCTLLASHGCDVLNRSLNSNTPLSSAIFYKKETCVLSLLRCCFIENTTSKMKNGNLNDYFYLDNSNLATYNPDNKTDFNLEWLQNNEKNLYPVKKLSLYRLIVSHKWEGVSWLILDELNKYGLSQLDVIVACLNASEFGLAYRLLIKFYNQEENKVAFKHSITQPNLEHSQTLLHLIASLELSISSEKENVNQILEMLLTAETNTDQYLIDQFVIRKDDFGSTAMHYACHVHNFDFIDFVLNYFSSNVSLKPESLLAAQKDSAQQTPYSLLFWQIGRITYTKAIRDKIKYYTMNFLNQSPESMNSDCISFYLETVSKAYFPVNSSYVSFMMHSEKLNERLIKDYPIDSKYLITHQQLSPLLYAINRQDLEMCKFLLKDLEFDVNSCDSNKICSLVYAIQSNNIRICQLLLNPSYESENEIVNNTIKPKMKAKNGLQAFSLLKLKTNKRLDDNNSDSSEEEENNEVSDDYFNEENNSSNLVDQTAESLFTSGKFKVKSNIILNHLDSKQRSIFHYLASSLDYGSFHNIEICKLLFSAFNSIDETKRAVSRMPTLSDFLKRVDSNVLSAADYALKNGNILLYEEIQKALNRPVAFDEQKLSKFNIMDRFYAGVNSVPNYNSDADMFLKKYLESEAKENVKDTSNCFKVDSLSNMSKIGSLVWDQKHHVPYDVLLTKTDVSYGLYGMHNFYKMQLITQTYNHLNGSEEKNKFKFDENQMCVLFTRWGRIGESGQYQRTPFSSFREARDEFCKIFKQKTANDFAETVLEKKKEFENKPKRYSLINLDIRSRPKLKEIDFEIFSSDSQQNTNSLFASSIFKEKSDYKEFFVDLLDVQFLKSQINTTHLSADYLPLARLSRETIEKATEILNKKLKPLIEKRMELEKISKKENLNEYMTLLDQTNKFSNEYYELIPQMNYNYEKLMPISTEKQLDEQMCTINKLSDAQIAIRILMGAKQQMSFSINPFDYVYRSLNSKLELLEPTQTEAKYILRYISPSRESSPFRVQRIFKFERTGEQDRFDKNKLPSQFSKLKNRCLLWHGTGTENVISILSKGLIKAPHDAKWTGQRFGKGIYFSDSFEMSNGYCTGRKISNKYSNGKLNSTERKYMFLCEVALGNVKELRTVHDVIESLPEGYDSVKFFGKKEPDPVGDVTLPNGSLIHLGERISCKLKPGEYRSMGDHQYVIYNEAQCCIRYIIQYSD